MTDEILDGGTGAKSLAGIRVLDLSCLLPGPYCTAWMVQHGASVIKVEEPARGDEARKSPPLGLNGLGIVFSLVNAGKKSVGINLRAPEGQQILRDLVRDADVLVESFRPGVMAKWGLDYPHLRMVNPQVVYCSLTGYGQEGPRAREAGHDINYLAQSGYLAESIRITGEPFLPPTLLADLTGSLSATLEILAALSARQRTGQGQYLDISLTNALGRPLSIGKILRLASGMATGPTRITGSRAGYHLYRTRDGEYLAVGALESRFWEAFCRRIGRREWIARWDDPEPQADLIHQVETVIAERTATEWTRELMSEDTCCTWVTDGPSEVDPVALFPVDKNASDTFLVPALGADTVSTLLELGYTRAAIHDWWQRGIVGAQALAADFDFSASTKQ